MYRDPPEPPLCPRCREPLRAFGERLCCDACTGIMLAAGDLDRALHDHAGEVAMTIALVDGKPSQRTCPRCRTPMITCHLDATFPGEVKPRTTHTKPELDRCAKHGVWFDADELAIVLEALRRASEPPKHASWRDVARYMIENSSFGSRLYDEPPRKPKR